MSSHQDGDSRHGYGVRGGIGYGRHIRLRNRRSVVAATVALVFAVLGVSALVLSLTGSNEQPVAPNAAQYGAITLPRPPATGPAWDNTNSHRSVANTSAQVLGKRSESRLAWPRGPLLNRSAPVKLDIPAVSIHTRLLRLGLNRDGTLQVPWKPLLAGWFTGSPTPGELGPAVIAGHVDSWSTGPAVFYRLGEVRPGDQIVVTRTDGTVAQFRADAVRAYSKDAFPTETVYGNTDRSALRLITCGGWNSARQAYDGNVVVFAHLVRRLSASAG